MKTRTKGLTAAILFCILCATTAVSHAAEDQQHRIKRAVGLAMLPVIATFNILGVAVGVTVAGKSYVFCYGVASTQPRHPVTRNTLFEIGSVTKTFTATMASYAAGIGDLSLSERNCVAFRREGWKVNYFREARQRVVKGRTHSESAKG